VSLDTSWDRIRRYLGWVVGGIGLILAWFAGFELIERFVKSQDAISVAANIYVVVTAVLAIVLTIVRQWMTMRKEKYANITTNLRSIMHEIRDLNTFIKSCEPTGGTEAQYNNFIESCKGFFGKVLDQLSAMFGSLTSTNCRTAIKLVYAVGTNMHVYTLARDESSRIKCSERDNRRLVRNHDPLEDNPQFAELFSDTNHSWHFLCNDLTALDGFRSTSLTAYNPHHATSIPRPTGFWRGTKSWLLPYRSTITCAIRQGPLSLNPGLQTNVIGFLTVDSESRSVFDDRWDVPLVFAVADVLYPVLLAYLELQNRATGT